MEISILDIISRIEKDQKELGITLYPKATESQILYFEERIGRKLPYDIRLFYSFANGFESAEDLFRIIPLEEILDNKEGRRLFDPTDFDIAEYMIYCDSWTMSIDTDHVASYKIYHGEVILTKSFSEFLTVFLNKDVYEFYNWKENIIAGEKENFLPNP